MLWLYFSAEDSITKRTKESLQPVQTTLKSKLFNFSKLMLSYKVLKQILNKYMYITFFTCV
jgi:hypothetical protein